MALITYITEHAAWADSFSHHDFRYVWGATFFQALSWGMELVALGWLVLDRTNSPFMVGVAFGVGMAPFFFLGVLSGAIADRVDRCVFLRFVALGGSFVSGLMALLLLTDVALVWHIITLAGAGGCIRAFLATMNQAYIYDIVGPKQALNGLALAALGHRMGVLVGSLMAGGIIAGIGVGGQYLIISTSYLAALTTLGGYTSSGPGGYCSARSSYSKPAGIPQVDTSKSNTVHPDVSSGQHRSVRIHP